MFKTSLQDNFLPNSIATTCIISGQCKSTADNVKSQDGIPVECNIANTSCSSCCQYGGDPQIFVKNLYAF